MEDLQCAASNQFNESNVSPFESPVTKLVKLQLLHLSPLQREAARMRAPALMLAAAAVIRGRSLSPGTRSLTENLLTPGGTTES